MKKISITELLGGIEARMSAINELRNPLVNCLQLHHSRVQGTLTCLMRLELSLTTKDIKSS
jgi:hypothetical protein